LQTLTLTVRRWSSWSIKHGAALLAEQNPIAGVSRPTTQPGTRSSVLLATFVNGSAADSEPEVYMSYLQIHFSAVLEFAVRASSNPVKLFPSIEQAVWSVDKDQPCQIQLLLIRSGRTQSLNPNRSTLLGFSQARLCCLQRSASMEL